MIRQQILNIMCRFGTEFDGSEKLLQQIKERLSELEKDGLVQISGRTIKVTQTGIPFVRNVCMAFDLKLHEHKPKERLFSQTV